MQQYLLATDLDGTLIPLDASPAYAAALARIRAAMEGQHLAVLYVTGRHLASVEEAILEYGLPRPHGMICDVGTTLYDDHDGQWQRNTSYQDCLAEITKGRTRADVEDALQEITALRLQEAYKQGPFKISYYTLADTLDATAAEVSQSLSGASLSYRVLASVDPFTGDGLIDVLPIGVDKAYVLKWLVEQGEIAADHLIYAGDSGNDTPVFESTIPATVVANTPAALQAQLQDEQKQKIARGDLYFATRPATQGVVEGCVHFGALTEG